MPQTSVNSIGQPVAFAGLISDNYQAPDLVSGFSEDTNPIPFGVAVKQGAAPAGCLNMSSSTDYIKGINAWGFEHSPGSFGDLDPNGVGVVPQGRLRILRRGRVWVVIDQTITDITPFEDRCYIRNQPHTGNGGGGTTVAPGGATFGAFSNVSDPGSPNYNTDMTVVGVFTSGIQVAADGTNIAEVEVDFTNKPTGWSAP